MFISITNLLAKPAAGLTAAELQGHNPEAFLQAASEAYAAAYNARTAETGYALSLFKERLGHKLGNLDRMAEAPCDPRHDPHHCRDLLVRHRQRLHLWTAQSYGAIAAVKPVGPEPAMEQPVPAPAPAPPRLDLAAWLATNEGTLLDPTKVRAVGGRLQIKSGVLTKADVHVAIEHAARIVAWMEAQWADVRPPAYEMVTDQTTRQTLIDGLAHTLARTA